MVYEIKNEKLKLQVDSLGAELISCVYNDEEYIYQRDTPYWNRCSPVLFPVVGRLKHNNYRYKNKSYSLPLHGFARHCEFELFKQSDTSLTFLLKENEQTLKHYPFSFELYLEYRIIDDYFELEYKVKSTEDILFSIGAHPAFNLFSNIENSYFEFEKDEEKELICLDMDINCISLETKKFSSSKVIDLKYDTFKNDALIFKDLKSKYVSLKNRDNDKEVKVEFEGFEYMAFWQPVGASFICIEPWCGIADYEDTNHKLEDKRSIISLKKDEEFKKKLKISFS